MAGSRDPLHDPGEAEPPRRLAVPPVPVGAARSGRRAWLALGTMAAVIAGAVVLAQLEPPATRPAPLPGDPAASGRAFTPAVTSAGPSDRVVEASPEALPPRLSRDQLRDRVLDGALGGHLVFVDGVLDVSPVRCQSPAQARAGCVDLAVRGLGLPVWAGTGALPWRGDPPHGAWLVTVARPGGLVYLGSLVPGEIRPESIGDLANRLRRGDPPASEATLFEVPGWLVVDPVHPCFRPGVAATPCPVPPPFLAADEPSVDGILRSSRGGEVELGRPVVGVGRDQAVTPGVFLVAPPDGCRPARALGSCRPGARWTVVARYDPAASVRVLVP